MKEVEYTDEIPTPDSRALTRVIYNRDSEELYVFFHNSSVPAGYKNVPGWAFDEFHHANSAGRYYQQEIKGEYHGVDTGDLVFKRAEPKVAPKVTPEQFHSVPSPMAHLTPLPDDSLPKQTYRVTYVEEAFITVSATSFDEAAAQVKNGDDAITVTGVTVV